jgi:hypothetical protein
MSAKQWQLSAQRYTDEANKPELDRGEYQNCSIVKCAWNTLHLQHGQADAPDTQFQAPPDKEHTV